MPTRLQIARKDIVGTLDRDPIRIFKKTDLDKILSTNRLEWRLAQDTTFQKFVTYLIQNARLRRIDFPFPARKEIRYIWGDVPFQAVLMTLKPQCHFSHYTAVQYHELTEQDPKTIYVNFEQLPKPQWPVQLEQGRIDSAFARKPRVTSNIAKVKDVRIVLLNGKCTGYQGIAEYAAPLGFSGVKLRVTDVERTLIDIAVRPFYAGGVFEVLKAFRLAAGRVSINRLAALLQKINYVYPYHQAIGFYLAKSGEYRQSAIDLFRSKFDISYNFYLDYAISEPVFDESWRVFAPRDL